MISPRGGPDNPLTRGLGHLRTTSVRSLDSPVASLAAQHRPQPSVPEVGTPGSTAHAAVDPQQRFGTKWQETEVVGCGLARSDADTREPSGGVTLDPGRTMLWFEVQQALRRHKAQGCQKYKCSSILLQIMLGSSNSFGGMKFLGHAN